MPSILRSIVLSTLGTISLVLALLWAIGDERFFPSLSNPHLLTSAGVLLLTNTGLFIIFKKEFLKKYFFPSLLLPSVWFAAFTWAYGYMYLPENKYLGDYYSMIFLLFSLSYLSLAWKWKLKRGAFLWSVLTGLFSFFMILVPLIYIGYYIIYKSEMDIFALMAIAMTNAREAAEFVETVAAPALIAAVAIFAIILLISCFYIARRFFMSMETAETPFLTAGRGGLIGFIIFTILFSGGFLRQMRHIFPLQIYYAAKKGSGSFKLMETLNRHLAENAKAVVLLPGQTAEDGTHIIVIGESASRDHMQSFTPGYPVKTTPWEDAMAKSPDFFFADKGYANFPTTVMSLSYALTNTNQYNKTALNDAVSLVDAAKAAGYRTDWISFQNRSSLASAGVSVIGERCDASYWENSLDGEAVKVMKKLPPAKKRVIFIHINGSHYSYLARVPMGYGKATDIPEDDPYYNYDVTLAYTDEMLHSIFTYAKEHLNLKTMIYFSDHAEDMVYYHGTSGFSYDMIRIPFWIYLSPDYRKIHPDILPALQSNKDKIFTNDLLFETASGIWQAKTNFYQDIYDLSSPSYVLDQEAVTMHGKLLITDDPKFKK